MISTLALKVNTKAEELDRIFTSVENMAAAENWPPEFTFKVNLVLEEIGLNVIKYGFDEGIHQFDVIITSDSELLTIEISDSGRPFNPLKDMESPNTELPMEERDIGGLGIHLARTLTDDFQYRRQHCKNYSTMALRKAN